MNSHMNFRISVLVSVVSVACASAAGAKKADHGPRHSHGANAKCTGSDVAPDGKAFAYREKGKILLYDIDSLKATEWFDIDALEKNKKLPRQQTGAFSWQNRRVNTSGMQWFSDSSAILVPVDGGLYVMDAHKPKPRITITEIGKDNVPTFVAGWPLGPISQELQPVCHEPRYQAGYPAYLDGTPTLLNGQLDWVYPEELDLGTAFWWSPDSKYIAYMQFDVSREMMYPHEDLLGERPVYEPQRFPQAGTPNALVRIGVVPANGGKTTWMQVSDPADSLLARVAWLPDSLTWRYSG